MKLPEAITLMLEGKVMVDAVGNFSRTYVGSKCLYFEFRHSTAVGWLQCCWFPLDGWREATPEELKEIGL